MGLLLLFPVIWTGMLIVASIGAVLRIRAEQRIWNNGVCRDTGSFWEIHPQEHGESGCVLRSGEQVQILYWLVFTP